LIDPIALRRKFTTPLLRWYARFGRNLPWRETRDPYAIWVSEIMLQQTQVSTAIPYYRRFLKEFPTPSHLSRAPLDRVLKVWEGLGYYARARNLKRAAEEVVRCHGGNLPSDEEALQKLPGIGRSTAGAILSIGYGQKKPILDGNVRRVLSRFFAVRSDPKARRTEEDLWKRSEALIPGRRAGTFAQAIMDLGAVLCVPKRPKCSDCPVSISCEAYRLGIQEELPKRRERKEVPHFHHVAGLVSADGKVLLCRRPQKGLLGGLWEFPGGRLEEEEGSREGTVRILSEMLSVPIDTAEKIGEVRHTFSHFKMTLHAYLAHPRHGMEKIPAGFRWVDREEVGRLALPTAQKKVLALFKTSSTQLAFY
jgi:A/G-specific adenine glycosylase